MSLEDRDELIENAGAINHPMFRLNSLLIRIK